ncbi:MAG: hypothetical protein IPM63_10015 [Acidobacteriota bacterium]|nr:MAG: hypothetical protein IPM63_10015 [Acidobacteriota bacterium]
MKSASTVTAGLIVLVWLILCPAGVFGQPERSPADDLLLEKIRVMEAQLEKLNKDLEALKTELAAKAPKAAPDAARKDEAPEPPVANEPPQDLPGVSLGNGIRLVPYGTVYFNAFANTSGTNNTDVPLWATANEEENLGMSLRQTRFGVRMEGARAGNAVVKGVVEADFYGGLPAVGVGENFGVVRLRVAKVRFEWEKAALSVGQDWIVFAPRNPTSLAAAAIPQFAASGNLWSRLPQVRAERKFAGGKYLIEGAVLAPTSGDFPSGPDSPFLLQPGAASRSLVPSFEGRAAYNGANWLGTGKPGSIAVSAHFGRTKVSGSDLASFGVAADWGFPIVNRVVLSGELFTGENLGGLQGGIFQGYNPDFVEPGSPEGDSGAPRGITTRGGWAQISFTPPVLKDRLSFHGSAGIDDPSDEDLFSASPRNWRTRNLSFAASVIYKPIPKLSIGGEFRRFETTYLITGRRTAGHFNLGAAYEF